MTLLWSLTCVSLTERWENTSKLRSALVSEPLSPILNISLSSPINKMLHLLCSANLRLLLCNSAVCVCVCVCVCVLQPKQKLSCKNEVIII